jgi:hypothetical protein
LAFYRGHEVGVVLRAGTTTSNLLAIYVDEDAEGPFVGVAKVVAGARTVLKTWHVNSNSRGEVVASVDEKGAVRVYLGNDLLGTVTDSVLATGGALASGKVGVYSRVTTTAFYGGAHAVDEFAAWVPMRQQVIEAGESVTATHESVERADGTRPPVVTGRYLTSPPAGREGRTHRLAIKLRRNDVDEFHDDVIDDTQRVDVTAIPRVALI